MEKIFSMIRKMNKFPVDLLFSIANEAISALTTNAMNNDRHPFVAANLDCDMKDLRGAESDWNATFHPFDMDEEDLLAHGEYLGDLEREGEKR